MEAISRTRVIGALLILAFIFLTCLAGGSFGSNPSSKVYMTSDITPKGLMSVYKALGREAKGRVAVKVHMGEPGNRNFLSPSLIKDLVQHVKGTIVECNVAYGGYRASTAMHLQVAKDHGFTSIAKVDILDAQGSISLPVRNGRRLDDILVGSRYREYDFFIILSHFKGHLMAGFGGAIKNMAVGLASAQGKVQIHTAGTSRRSMGLILSFVTSQEAFLESIAEAAKAISDDLSDRVVYINVMNRLSVDCDCFSNAAEPDMHDIGILGSLDPVALDRACVDLVFSAPDGRSLVERIRSRKGLYLLDYAEKIGLGTQRYELVRLND